MALLLSDSNRFRWGRDVTSITGNAFRGASWPAYEVGGFRTRIVHGAIRQAGPFPNNPCPQKINQWPQFPLITPSHPLPEHLKPVLHQHQLAKLIAPELNHHEPLIVRRNIVLPV